MATQYSCLESPMDRGGWRAAAMGPQRIGHGWAHMVIIHTTFNRRWGHRSVVGGHWHKLCDIPRNCWPRAGPGAVWSQQTLQEDSFRDVLGDSQDFYLHALLCLDNALLFLKWHILWDFTFLLLFWHNNKPPLTLSASRQTSITNHTQCCFWDPGSPASSKRPFSGSPDPSLSTLTTGPWVLAPHLFDAF